MPVRRPEAAKILMVDDRPENLLALEAILQGLGHQLIKARSGEEALKHLLTEDVALMLLDVQMPGMDGFETAAHVKKREKTRDIPILFLTAIDGGAHQAFRGYAAGAVDYLSKPFDPWVLKAKVSVFVELYERRRALAEQAADLRRQLEAYDALRLTERVVDLASAVRRAGGLADGSAAPELVTALQQAVEATQVLERALGILPESAVPGGVGA